MLFFLLFSFFYFSVATFISLSFRLPFGPSRISYFFSLSHPKSSRRFLRHRPRSMSICIICFVSDSSGSSWQPAIFGATRARSISLRLRKPSVSLTARSFKMGDTRLRVELLKSGDFTVVNNDRRRNRLRVNAVNAFLDQASYRGAFEMFTAFRSA